MPQTKKRTYPFPISFVDDKLFKIADAHAAEALYLTATGNASNVTEETDVLGELVRASRHFDQADYDKTSGDMVCACTDAGIAFGLAFGLRLRGAR